MEFRIINSDYPYDLLYLADPYPEALADYLERGECWGAYMDDEIVGEYVIIHTRPFTAEIVNVAVAENMQGRGIGKALVKHAIERARERGFQKIEIGTGDFGEMQIALYTKCGFSVEWMDKDFFVKHYPEPIFDNGIQCRNMVRMGLDL